ncbi:response regulator [Herbaspirillum sp. RTI4]|uniref:HD domain-containing phosphohydrolase n=2 Tax=Pseudomonadota TaxID=1224 RepID=UPI002AB4AC82|nr:HD domain-containing phosphohydrolase [Herbaspirillum sp. RTI4]MDY7578230.1 response regulator [Herbaspirillum sp. RTI4]MEA9981568.1 response regulator [Herbaspirillum sp. RTI4]
MAENHTDLNPQNPADNSPPAVILLVDDESSILSSLKRLFRPYGYKILTAEGGAAGLEVLATEPVDLIISDMRMPDMNGAQFLALAKDLYPDTVRILLTGYAEIDATIAAINDGGVYHYANKPWDERNLSMIVKSGLEQSLLKKEAVRLSEETLRLNQIVRQQNEELTAFNLNLETQVIARTEEIRQTVLFLESTAEDTKRNFLTMLKVFSSMIELRSGAFGGHSSRIGDLSRKLGSAMQLSEHGQHELMIAGLLHGIGKIGLSDELVRKPMEEMTQEEARVYMAHPLKGQAVLTPVEAFNGAGRIIRHQYERYNGRGTPDGIAGDVIPIGARILAVIRDFEELRTGAISTQPLSNEKAISVIKSQSERRYDPAVVTAFLQLMVREGLSRPLDTLEVEVQGLMEGMQLADDLMTLDGILLLAKDYVLKPQNIDNLIQMQKLERLPQFIMIRRVNLQEPDKDADSDPVMEAIKS